MPAAPSATDLLLLELRNRLVTPESYSRRSLLGRLMPTLIATVLALVAVIGGMVLCESTAPRPVGVSSADPMVARGVRSP